MGSELAKKQGVSRRKFFQSTAGMAAGYWAMNGTYGPLYAVSRAEAQTPEMANARANALKGLGADHIVWGSDAVWTGAPQWQIEGLRRLEIPVSMQEKYGFTPLGTADGPVKNAIFGGNSARLYGYTMQQRAALDTDPVALARAEYDLHGEGRTNLRYGYMQRA